MSHLSQLPDLDLESRLDVLHENLDAMEKAMSKKKQAVLTNFRDQIEDMLEEIRVKIGNNQRDALGKIDNLEKLMGEIVISVSSIQRQIEGLGKKRWYDFGG